MKLIVVEFGSTFVRGRKPDTFILPPPMSVLKKKNNWREKKIAFERQQHLLQIGPGGQ